MKERVRRFGIGPTHVQLLMRSESGLKQLRTCPNRHAPSGLSIAALFRIFSPRQQLIQTTQTTISSGSSPMSSSLQHSYTRESDFQVTLWCIHQRDSLQYPLSSSSNFLFFPEASYNQGLPQDQRVFDANAVAHGIASDQ